MNSSRNIKNNNLVLSVYKDVRTVFRLKDIALMIGEADFQVINRKLNYAVKTEKLLNPRKGIYTKPKYNKEELASVLYTPSYLSLEYVLQKEGVVFQYDSRITSVGYLSRSVNIDSTDYAYRKIKGEILVNTAGIIKKHNHVNIATPERAFLDLLYLDHNFVADNISSLNTDKLMELVPIYSSKVLAQRVPKIIKNG